MVEPVPQNLGLLLMLSGRDFQRRLDTDLQTRGVAGIRTRHREVFSYLARHGASRSVDLAAASGVRPQSMMKIIQELEGLGMVERAEDPSDSRAKLATLTARGRTLLNELAVSTEVVWDQYCELLSENTVQEGASILAQMIGAEEKT